jgi:glutaredoxin
LVVVLAALIGAGALFVLSGGSQTDSEPFEVASTLKDLTSRVIPSSAGGEDGETASSSEDDSGVLGLGRWFGKGEPEPNGSIKDVYYQYVDDSGSVHFVQNIEEVPARWRDRAGRIEVERSVMPPSRGRPAATRRTARARPADEPFAYQPDPEVVVYTTSWCGWCRKTLAFLDERGVRYVNKDIEASDWHRDELISKTGRTSVPVVEIDGEIIRGYNAQRMEELLGRRS